MSADELRVLLEYLEDKFQLVAEGHVGLVQRFDRLEDAVVRLGARLDSHEIRTAAALSTFRDEVAGRFDALEGRAGAVEGRLGTVEERLGAVEERLGTVEAGLTDVRSEVAGLRQDQRLSALESRVSCLERAPRPPRRRP